MKRVHIIISGVVQGIGFRYFVVNKAKELNINGFVRNTMGGNVEAVFIGDEKKVDAIVEYCKKGPIGSIVENVNVEDDENNETFDSFEVRM